MNNNYLNYKISELESDIQVQSIINNIFEFKLSCIEEKLLKLQTKINNLKLEIQLEIDKKKRKYENENEIEIEKEKTREERN